MLRRIWIALLLVGCGATRHSNLIGKLDGQYPNAVVMRAGNGNRTAALDILPPISSGFQTQALVHRWVSNDIYEYRATLRLWNGSAFADFNPALIVTVPQKPTPKAQAVFTNLRQGTKYQVGLTAVGSAGGNLALYALNTVVPTAVFDFSGFNDLPDTLNASLQITFDPVPFSGSGNAIVTMPADGVFSNPTAPETGSAQ